MSSGLDLKAVPDDYLPAVARTFHEAVPIKDHTYHMKTYAQCFLGSEGVTALVDSKLCNTREEALALGQQLLQDGYIEHVTKEHQFEDSGSFFRFVGEMPTDSKHHEFGFNLAQETFADNTYATVAPGVYSFSEEHFPAGVPGFGALNNRGIVFEVWEEGKEDVKSLIMSGIPGDLAITKMRKLERETGLKLTTIISSGDFHHMAMKSWLTEYPDITIVMSGIRFPKTRNGQVILANDEWKSRIELINDAEPSTFASLSVAKYAHIVRFFGFDQFFYYTDKAYMSQDNKTPAKGGTMQFLKSLSGEPADAPCLMVWCYHVASKSLLVEHNFNIYLSAAHHKSMPFLMRQAMPKCYFGSACGKVAFPAGPKTEEGCQKHCAQMAYVLQECDVRWATDYHAYPGVAAKQWNSKEHFVTDMKHVLEPTGEHVADGSAMWAISQPKGACVIS